MGRYLSPYLLVLIFVLTGCGPDLIAPNQGGLPGGLTCPGVTDISLAVGQDAVIDPANNGGCVRFPAAGAGGAEYLYAAVATNGQESGMGSYTSYQVRGDSMPPFSASVAPRWRSAFAARRARSGLVPNGAFDAMLRDRERTLALAPGALALSRARLQANAAVVPPVVGSQRTFKVCKTADCTAFVDVTATATHVGPKGAIYLDDSVPADGYTGAEIDSVGLLFDQYLYPIDTLSFGRESDLDNNGVVVVLLTDQVNTLSPNCNTTGSVILGFFYGNDLLPGNQGSNAGEIFYGLVPDPDNTTCTISHEFASSYLAPTFIHEFQHMISFNQHVLLRGGVSEDTWLNEGLSHYAEELGGRGIPDPYCFQNDCLSQFAVGDIQNAYAYLQDPESYFVVEPTASNGSLEERGANWLLVRWLVDQFGADLTGASFTRSLVGTSLLGFNNVAAATGVPMTTLVPQWQLANYLDNLPGFSSPDGRLGYSSWNFRNTFGSLHTQDVANFPLAYPLVPDSMRADGYRRRGTLRAGSGPHLRVIQAGNAPAIRVQLTDSLGLAFRANAAAPRVGIVRIR